MKEIVVRSLDETNQLATKITELLAGNGCLCLQGDLGAGKTTFTKQVAKCIGIEDVITSPTFQILKLYDENDIVLRHIDAYRLEGIKQDLGFEELLEDDGITVIEWYQYMSDFLPKERLEINIELQGDTRIFKFNPIGDKYIKLVEEL